MIVVYFPLGYKSMVKNHLMGSYKELDIHSWDIGIFYDAMDGLIKLNNCQSHIVITKGILYDSNKINKICDIICDIPDAINHIDGIFSLIDIHDSFINIFTDLSGIYQIYYSVTPDLIILTDRISLLKRLLKPQPNNKEILVYSLTSLTTPGNTIYKDIYKTLPAHRINLDINGKRFSRSYYVSNLVNGVEKQESFNTICDRIIELIKDGYSSLKNDLNIDKVLCDLSGGLDSRVTTILAEKVFDKVFTRTGGTPEEKRIASQLRNNCLSVNEFQFTQDYIQKSYIDYICDEFPGEIDCYTVSKVFQLNLYEKEYFRLKIGGNGGEFIKDYWVLDINPKFLNFYISGSMSLNQERNFKKWYLNFYLTNRFFEKRLEKSIVYNYLVEVLDFLNDSDLNILNYMDQLSLVLTLQPMVSAWQKMTELAGLILWHPFLTNKMIQTSLFIPFQMRRFNKLHSCIISKVNKKCADIRVDKKLFKIITPFKPRLNQSHIYYYLFMMERIAVTLLKEVFGNYLKSFNRFNKAPDLRHIDGNFTPEFYNVFKIFPELKGYLNPAYSIRDQGMALTLLSSFSHLL